MERIGFNRKKLSRLSPSAIVAPKVRTAVVNRRRFASTAGGRAYRLSMTVQHPAAIVAKSRGAPPRLFGLGAAARVAALTQHHGSLDGEALLRRLIEHEFRGRVALVSSFGAESAIVLGLVAAIDRRTPVTSSRPTSCSPRPCAIATSSSPSFGSNHTNGRQLAIF